MAKMYPMPLTAEDIATIGPELVKKDYHPNSPKKLGSKSASKTESASKVASDQENFLVCLDVSHFGLSEMSLKIAGRQIIFEAKHDERQEEVGMISRHFKCKYNLAKTIDTSTAVSSLSSGGILCITATNGKQKTAKGERHIPIVKSCPDGSGKYVKCKIVKCNPNKKK